MSHSLPHTLHGFLTLIGTPVRVSAAPALRVAELFAESLEVEPPISGVSENFRRHFQTLSEDGVGPGTVTGRAIGRTVGYAGLYDLIQNVPLAFAHLSEFLSHADPSLRYVFFAINRRGHPQPGVASWKNRGWDMGTALMKAQRVSEAALISYL